MQGSLKKVRFSAKFAFQSLSLILTKQKGPWSKEEDAQLLRLVNEHGLSWVTVAEAMMTRGADRKLSIFMKLHRESETNHKTGNLRVLQALASFIEPRPRSSTMARSRGKFNKQRLCRIMPAQDKY